MARLTQEQAQLFPENSGRTNFLSLQNDKDQAIIRFAYKNIREIPIYLIHPIQQGGKTVHIGCLRSDYAQPNSVCPMCQSGSYPKKVVYFNVRNEQSGEMQVWQRSEKQFEGEIKPYLQPYDGNLNDVPFMILRNGAKGDTNTKYAVIAQPIQPLPIEQFPEEVDVEEKGIIKNYSFNELQNYVYSGNLPINSVQNMNDSVLPRTMTNNDVIERRTRSFVNDNGGY